MSIWPKLDARMRNAETVSVLLFAGIVAAQPIALADAFGLQSVVQSENYGINYPEQQQAASAADSQTSHHRFGRSTGIGSSSLETEANTSEVMSRVQYTPTANPPYTQTIEIPMVHEGLPKIRVFSQRMVSVPTPAPTYSQMPELRDMLSPAMPRLNTDGINVRGVGAPESISPGVDMPIWQPFGTETQRFETQIDNPFNHL